MIRTLTFSFLLSIVTVSNCYAAEPAERDALAKSWAAEHVDEIAAFYRELHQSPELSLLEEETSAKMATELRKIGADVRTNIGGFGVIGVLENGSGKTIMLRADMDALPVVEETGLDYASKVKTQNERGQTVGVMHACGHDIHMSNLVGIARFLSENRDAWKGTVVFLFQPAEEKGAGAKAMLDDGLLTLFPRPDFALALHVAADYPAGSVGYCPGFSQANVDSVDITIKGRGGHGAYPETTIDPVVIAAKLVLDLQTIVSREIKPTEPAVITVGAIEGGTKHNIIADDCQLLLTVRSYSPQVRQQLAEAIKRKAYAAAESAGAPEPVVELSEGTPSLYNDPDLTARVVKVMQRTLGEDKVKQSQPSMGGEDFSRYGIAGIPIVMFKVGSVDEERLAEFAKKDVPPPSLHSALYYPNPEPTLRTSMTVMGAAVLELLNGE